MALDRKCIVCPDKHHYKYCNNCNGYNSLETWRFIFCSENCRGIYKIASEFVSGELTGSEAKIKLKDFDLSDLEFYHSIIKQNINDILASDDIECRNAIEESEKTNENAKSSNEKKDAFKKEQTVNYYSNSKKRNRK